MVVGPPGKRVAGLKPACKFESCPLRQAEAGWQERSREVLSDLQVGDAVTYISVRTCHAIKTE